MRHAESHCSNRTTKSLTCETHRRHHRCTRQATSDLDFLAMATLYIALHLILLCTIMCHIRSHYFTPGTLQALLTLGYFGSGPFMCTPWTYYWFSRPTSADSRSPKTFASLWYHTVLYSPAVEAVHLRSFRRLCCKLCIRLQAGFGQMHSGQILTCYALLQPTRKQSGASVVHQHV